MSCLVGGDRLHAAYIADMAAVTSELSRVLTQGGHASFIVGDSTLRGVFVENSKIVSRVAESRGLELIDYSSRDLPQNRRYLSSTRTSEFWHWLWLEDASGSCRLHFGIVQ